MTISRRTIAIIVFIIGLCIIFYPLFTKIYYNYNTENELKQIYEENSIESQRAHQTEAFEAYNESIKKNDQNVVSPPVEVFNKEHSEIKKEDSLDVIGTVEIPALKIHYPIYDKATPENVDRGVSRVEGTSYPTGGKDTNMALAAHSYSPYHEWFTNIDKLHDKDIIIINNFKETLYYEVTGIEIIEPTQVEKLEIQKGKDMITLITCTADEIRRIIVYAERTFPDFDVKKVEIPKRDTSNVEVENNWLGNLKILFESKWMILFIFVLVALFIRQIKKDDKHEDS